MTRFITRLARLRPHRGPLSGVMGSRLLFGLAVALLAAVPLAVRTVPIGLVEGEPAPRTFRATRPIQYVDQGATAALRRAASQSISPVYVFDADAQSEARRSVVELFSAAESASASPSMSSSRRLAFMMSRYGSEVDTRTAVALLALPAASMDKAEHNTEALVGGIMSGRIMASDLAEARNQLTQSAELIPLSLSERYVVIAVGSAYLRPTMVVDADATARAREKAADAVAPIVVLKQEGENIVSKGEVVTALEVQMVRSLGGLEQGADLRAILASVALMTLLLFAVGAYLQRFEERTWLDFKRLSIMAVLLLGMMYLTRAASLLVPEVSAYAMPVPLAAVLGTLLIGPVAGVLLTLLTTVAGLLLGFAGGVQVVASLLASVGAVVAMANVSQRSHLLYAGLAVAGVMSVAAFGASLASGDGLRASALTGVYGAGGGLAAAVLTIGLLPFFEYAFGVTTDIRLLELANPGHPLLRRLMAEAPGTYSHSVMTANLAESAAEEIGANPLLARVGAYFHDVGKIERPTLFVENQVSGVNPHDTLAPAVSARIIEAHVPDGVALAQRYKLPPEVVAIIRQHHGTSVVSYFYDKAVKAQPSVREADFRYAGALPSSAEAALVMLADSCEAAVRAVADPTPEAIGRTVRRVTATKVSDGQLGEAPVTFAQLECIIRVYARVLASVYHPRVAYPMPQEREETDAGQCHEPSRV